MLIYNIKDILRKSEENGSFSQRSDRCNRHEPGFIKDQEQVSSTVFLKTVSKIFSDVTTTIFFAALITNKQKKAGECWIPMLFGNSDSQLLLTSFIYNTFTTFIYC